MAANCKILSLDGGGVKVLAQAIILKRIFQKFPTFYDSIEVFAGTSAGSFLALALAERGTDALDIFTPETITAMFQRNYSLKIWPSEGITAAEYSNQALQDFLGKQFGNLTIGNLKKKVLIPAFKLSAPPKALGEAPKRWHPSIFTNIGEQQVATELVTNVALRSSAAPTYFPIFENYVDGGVFANNPAALTVAHCRKQGIRLKDICVLSLSGGAQGEAIVEQSGNWGCYQWMTPLIDMLIESNVFTANLLCQELLGERYFRFALPLSQPVALDGLDKLVFLMESAENVDLEPVYRWIENEWFEQENKTEFIFPL